MADLQPMQSERAAVRDILSDHLSWTPHNFIRKPGTFIAADRAVYAEQLTREMDEQNDLRFVYKDGDLELALFAERLPWDTEFFGYGVGRLNGIFPLRGQAGADYSNALAALLEQARARGITYLFAPIHPEDLDTIRALGQASFTLIETRLYFHRNLTDYEFPQRFPVRAAVADDVPSLGRTARDTINAYDRFHSDPFLRKEDVDRLMVEWVQASVNKGFADITLVPDVPEPTAFCTLKYYQEYWDRWGLKLGQPIISAVSPELHGWYMKLISECCYQLKAVGAEHCFLVTQITNRAVLRVWEKLDFTYGRGEHIFRIVL